uniref:UBA domain-containing protein n=1 Tax=Caenorhabditis japonica TaxID=281687 RepID=A0A8R1DZU0_CAEJA
MSFTNSFHDYINDIPMNMNRRFCPTQIIDVDAIYIPERLGFSRYEYNFVAENRAREQFDKQDESIVSPTIATTSAISHPNQKTSENTKQLQHPIENISQHPLSVLSKDVLVPVSVNSVPSIAAQNGATHSSVSLRNSFHEFESLNNVFDDIHISALDDRKALQEVLMSSSNASTQSDSSSPTSFTNVIRNNQETVKKPKEKSGEPNEDLRKRLLAKGYRRDIVETAISKLPKARLVHIEYYMKACRTVEKTGKCPIDEVLLFLINSKLTDKNVILSYSETCAALLNMGFDREKVFDAVEKTQGEKEKALNILLSIS